ncbi:folliculin isoform X2 [Lycorma delicatula]|uniref:folliculin isoform X2 n=1 Tax=Lycorma delicatula TaxID=130591 RepID=UPI003F515F22
MSAVIAICHFCDQHGPSVLLNTRVQHGSTNYSQECRVPISSNAHSVCSACEMVGQFVSVDQITQVQYVSCQLPVHMPQLTSWLQHICVRSLSCEVNPCLFSEKENCAMSISFSVRDAMSRGFYRWFSIVITMRDLTLLAASWQFLYHVINVIISQIKDKALQVYNVERPFRFNNPPQSRSLMSLTKSKHIFAWLHSWFSWLLRVESRYFHERIHRSPYYYAKPDINIDNGDLRCLRTLLTPDIFTQAVLGLIEGKQLVIRGDMPALVKDAVNSLKEILPYNCCKLVTDSNEYIEPTNCNLLGVGTHVAVPRPSNDVIRIDILNGICRLKTLESLPSRYPTLLVKLLKALDNQSLNNKTLAYYLVALKQEWIKISP